MSVIEDIAIDHSEVKAELKRERERAELFQKWYEEKATENGLFRFALQQCCEAIEECDSQDIPEVEIKMKLESAIDIAYKTLSY